MVEQEGRMGHGMMGGPRNAQTMVTERAGNRTFNGTTITTDMKYDHYINGWDFESYDNVLALETHLLQVAPSLETLHTALHDEQA